MWFRSLFDAWLARSSRTPVSRIRRVPRVRPLLEILEDRTLLSTYTVNALTDTGAGSGLTGDLRYCVTNATSGSDTITFASGLTGTITLQSQLPTMPASVAITGPGANKVTVTAAAPSLSPFFTVGSAATVQISGLTLANSGQSAILNDGSLVASNMSFTLSVAQGNGYTIDNQGSATVSNSIFSDNNGGIYNNQTLDVSNCTFSRNETALINNLPATVSDSVFSGNYGEPIANGGNLTINACTLSNNGGRALYNSQHATLAVNKSTISDNSGGGIDNLGSATISYSTISGNIGGGIDNLGSATISYSTISGNIDYGNFFVEPYGGGINNNAGTLTVNNSTISGNKAIGNAEYATGNGTTGGVVGPGDGMGGGIYSVGGTLTINSSTLAANQAIGGSTAGYNGYPGGSGIGGNGTGGALYMVNGTVTINNSTIAGNQGMGGAGSTPGTGYGGGIYNDPGNPATLRIYDTIIADNTTTADPDLDGSFTSQGHNLISNSTGGSGFAASDLLNVHPQLGPLQNNGGPTQTMALLAGSPAINAGDNTNAPAYDQRGPGFPRIVGGRIDIGAFEVQDLSGVAVSGFPATITAGATTGNSFTVTARNADGSTNTNYTGTIILSSTDPTATFADAATGTPLSGNSYTFRPGDNGTHTFTAVLTKAGYQSITATDNTNASFAGTEGGIRVQPAAANTMIVAGFPTPIDATAPGTFSVTLKDRYGNIASGYTGTVQFSTSDPQATIDNPVTGSNVVLQGFAYTFTAGDAGVHTFYATFATAGTQSITATDTTTPSLTGTDGGITVNPAAASKFILTAPASVSAGQSFSLTVTVEDAYDNVVVSYAGTVHFSSTDSRAKLPRNYTFTASDKGVHTFTGLVLHTKGNQKITVTDTKNSALTGSVIVDVLSGTKTRGTKDNGKVVSQDESESWRHWELAVLSDLDAEDGPHRR